MNNVPAVRFKVLIPARLESTRLPNKALADIGGIPMVVRVAQQASKSHAEQVYIATDHPEIAQVAALYGVPVVMTDKGHATGTDRLSQAVEILGLDDEEIIVNVQGDEPLIEPALIDSVAQGLQQSSACSIATAAYSCADAELFFNPNVVKVVLGHDQRALYFSRAPIPWPRDAMVNQSSKNSAALLPKNLPVNQHLGIYAYRCGFLKLFPQLKRGELESYESLEQLRVLENGYAIQVVMAAHKPVPGVDTPDDLERVRHLIQS